MITKYLLWLSALLIFTLLGFRLLAFLLLVWVVYWYPAWGVFVIAVLIDGYTGAFTTIPTLSLSVGALVILVEAFKLFLLSKVHE